VTPEEIVQVAPRLVEFVAGMLTGLPRADQRATGELYVRGLLMDGARKSMQPMAERLGVDHQRLQQFITSSTWDYMAVRRAVATWAVEVIRPEAYAIDDSGFPKDGKASACVARMYCGALGKTGNCQIGVSVQMVTDAASVATNWRLFCPESWDDTTVSDPAAAEEIRGRRSRAGLPDDVRHREKWRQALDMLDEVIHTWGLGRLPVTADAGYGDITAFRLGLEERNLRYALAVSSALTAHSADAVPAHTPTGGRGGRPSKLKYRDPALSLKAHALAAGRDAFTEVTWRAGTRRSPENPDALMRSHFAEIAIRPANREIPRAEDGTLPLRTLLVEWPPDADEPTDYWLVQLPAGTDLATTVRLAKIRWRIEHDYRELKTGLGLDHFEGRSYTGWNRHVTLVCLAQAFATLLRLDPKAPAPA
jgi:SRSO17 transposase